MILRSFGPDNIRYKDTYAGTQVGEDAAGKARRRNSREVKSLKENKTLHVSARVRLRVETRYTEAEALMESLGCVQIRKIGDTVNESWIKVEREGAGSGEREGRKRGSGEEDHVSVSGLDFGISGIFILDATKAETGSAILFVLH